MLPLSRVKRCLRLPGNVAGQDCVVGDLHGHRQPLEHRLEQLGFDTRCDRLFSVGALIDRGPDSLACLALVEPPWFHALLGNHEPKLLDPLGYYRSRLQANKDFTSGGAWLVPALAPGSAAVCRSWRTGWLRTQTCPGPGGHDARATEADKPPPAQPAFQPPWH